MMRLNLRGIRFEVDSTTVTQQCPGSRLSRLIQNESKNAKEQEDDKGRNQAEKEFYFNRNPVIFHGILDFYQSRQLHVPSSVCASQILDELAFWEIDPEQLAFCCRKRVFEEFNETRSSEQLLEKWSKFLTGDSGGRAASVSSVTSREPTVEAKPSRRMRLWHLMETPRSSRAAKVRMRVIHLSYPNIFKNSSSNVSIF